MEWLYIMLSLSCFFRVAYIKLAWPSESLIVFGVLMIYPLWQFLRSINGFEINRWKWRFNLLQIQQRKIRTLEKYVTELKDDNKLLVDEITGLHKMWMEQPAPAPIQKKPYREPVFHNKEQIAQEALMAQIEYSEGIDIIPKTSQTKDENTQWQEIDLMDKSPL
ncbi:MAG: hypothetical protein JNL11_07675 [Bdellovibrionaceae bacterium]|nr:hypothetical protein [Pseudobdellovibrionaceae bacterium]